MSKRSESLVEDRDWVGDQIGKAEVVDSEDNNGMEVRVKAGDVGRKEGNGLGDGDELSRLCLGCFCHIGRSIIGCCFAVTRVNCQHLGLKSLEGD